MPTQLELEALHRQESSEHNAKILEAKVTRGKADIFDGKIPEGQLPTLEKKVLNLLITVNNFVLNQSSELLEYTLTEGQMANYDVINIVASGTGYTEESFYYVRHPLFQKHITINIGLSANAEVSLGLIGNKGANVPISLHNIDFWNGYTFLNAPSEYDIRSINLSRASIRMVYDGFVTVFGTTQHNGEI